MDNVIKNKSKSLFGRIRRTCHLPVGKKVHDVYELEVSKNGIEEVVKTTKKDDWYNKIQSHKDSCNISNLLARYQNGDVGALNQRVGQFGDFSDLPDDINETHAILVKAENDFNNLPMEVRAKFGFDFSRFLNSRADVAFAALFKKPEAKAPVENKGGEENANKE